ncbi:MAG: TonB-dependent receptor, partial [Candidatus Aminicenantes bacterium]|nr:TonB-dependent receptor [Candidatus Aminicenantes bacterium]
MSTTARIAIGIIFLIFSSLGPLAAQDGRVPVEGTVFDSSGRVLVGADVFLRDLDSGLEIHQVTGNEGRFQFLAERGRYQVTAAMSGFDSATRDLDLEESGPADLRLQLAPAALDTQVVVVSGSREQELIENSTTKVDVIPKRMLHDSGYETVRDVLAEEPGIVTRCGSSGGRSETQIQGIDSRQSLILIDGLPVVGAKGIKRGILNMDRQSVGRLERIEIVKGASSAVYGSDAIGGVINMITREPRYPLEASVTTSGGSLNRFDMRADVGFVKDKWSGFFEAERHKQNPFNLIPSRFGTTGPGFHRYDYLGKLGYEFSDRFKLRATAHAFVNQDKGGYTSESGPTESITEDTAQHYALSADVGLTPLTSWNLRGFYGKYDESSVLDILPQPGSVNSVANLNQRLYRLDSSISHVLGARQLLQGGVEWIQDEYRGFNRVLGDNDGQGIDMVDLWINDRVSVHERLVLTLGSRFNRHNLYGSHFVPRASGLFRVTQNLRLRGTLGRGFRAPDLGQLYFRFQNPAHYYQVIGNTHLQPERSTTYQAGFDYGAALFRFAANFFRNDIQELIQAEYIGFPTNPGEMQGLLRTYGIGTGCRADNFLR